MAQCYCYKVFKWFDENGPQAKGPQSCNYCYFLNFIKIFWTCLSLLAPFNTVFFMW